MGRVLRNQNGGNPDKMEKEGFVTRKIYSEDRRINRISLTTKADAAWNSIG